MKRKQISILKKVSTEQKIPSMMDLLEEEFTHTDTYRKVLQHRGECQSWKLWSQGKSAPLCLECFGGGLTKFILHTRKEIIQNNMKRLTGK